MRNESTSEDEQEKESVNPAARKDEPGEPHGSEKPGEEESGVSPRGFQKAELEPRDQGGIAE